MYLMESNNFFNYERMLYILKDEPKFLYLREEKNKVLFWLLQQEVKNRVTL